MYVRCQMDSSRAEHWIRSLTCFPFAGQGKQLVATKREASRPNAPIRMHAMPRRRVRRLRSLRGRRRPSAGFPCVPTPCVDVFASSCSPVSPVSPVSPSSRRSLREWVEATRRHDDDVRDIYDAGSLHVALLVAARDGHPRIVSEYEYECEYGGRRPSSIGIGSVKGQERKKRNGGQNKSVLDPRPRQSHELLHPRVFQYTGCIRTASRPPGL